MVLVLQNSPKKILILRLGAIGDIVHSSGLFRSLKNKFPESEIHYVAFNLSSILFQNDPDLKKVWILQDKSYKTLIKLALELRLYKFDLFINLQPSIRTKFFSFFVFPNKTLIYKKSFKMHAVENFFDTARRIYSGLVLDNTLKIFLPHKYIENASQLINSDIKTVVFNVGTSNVRQGRKWPIEYWIKLAENLIYKFNCDIILTGSSEDVQIADELLKVSEKVRSFCGKTSLLESAGLISKCNLMISGDTGPLHIATALNTPVIGLYGAAPVSRTGPYGLNTFALSSDMECVPCNKRKCSYISDVEIYTPCMRDITPEKVLETIEKFSILSN